jgi:lipopolysaccharide/colanic/teichoic acid biosynthesis glycosyltransferase
MDMVLSVVGLVVLTPVFLLVAFLVLVTSGRPIIYRGKVVGRDGRPFDYFKFRTMVPTGDDKAFAEFVKAWVEGQVTPFVEGKERIYKVESDPRITALGRLLRRWSVDELPQLFNVLRGEMSLVGPRPPVLQEHALYGDRERGRLAVRPGITGLAQVTARNRLTFEEMLRLDLAYIRRRSIGLDMWILIRTIGVVISGRGAR